MGRRKRPLPSPAEATVESLSHDGRGVTHVDGKTVFVDGALTGERVRLVYTRVQPRYDEARVETLLEPSPDRVEPRCAHFGVCGGCSLQHLAPEAQVRTKEQAMLDALKRIGGVEPTQLLPPLRAESDWGYRRKARLGVKYVPKKGRVLVGFRERGSGFVTDVRRCEVMHLRVGGLIEALGELIGSLSVRDQVPQIEVAMGDEACVLVFRLLQHPSDQDQQALLDFAGRHRLGIYIQEGGPDTVRPLEGQHRDLSYRLPSFDLRLHFEPLDFTQVNTEINRLMVSRAVDLLGPAQDERVLDLFCGLGNFTLPLARRAQQVVGAEGDPALVERARDNARRNCLGNVHFVVANLHEPLDQAPWAGDRFHKVLLDPPRSGAAEVLPLLLRLGSERIVYVSCSLDTLARDAGMLVGTQGYRLAAAGVMDMFPHTGHVESMALFEKL
jgi:23S rRNA (uracil1939-C5)-methyltransferase